MTESTLLESEIEKYARRQKKGRRLIAALIAALVAAVIWSASVGSSSVDLPVVLKTLGSLFGGASVEAVQRSIVLDVRLPRVFCAALAGACLSMAGLIMQGIFQNPLVSPYTLGVSNGASFGASLAIVLSAKLSYLGMGSYLTPAFAFLFSMLTMLLVYTISKLTNHATKTLILSGVAIGQLASVIAASHIRSGRLVPLLTRHVADHAGFFLYYGSRAAQPVRARAFIDLALKRLTNSNEFVLSEKELAAAERKGRKLHKTHKTHKTN